MLIETSVVTAKTVEELRDKLLIKEKLGFIMGGLSAYFYRHNETEETSPQDNEELWELRAQQADGVAARLG